MTTPTNREDLHDLLVDTLGSGNVYYNSPESVKMEYPAIRYSLDNVSSNYANDSRYINEFSYALTLIDIDADSDIFIKMLELPNCRHNRNYVADGLYHYVFTIKC